MRTINCPHCGQHVEVDSLDDPPRFVDHPADDQHPRRFAIIGGRTQWLLHRCDIPHHTQTRHDD